MHGVHGFMWFLVPGSWFMRFMCPSPWVPCPYRRAGSEAARSTRCGSAGQLEQFVCLGRFEVPSAPAVLQVVAGCEERGASYTGEPRELARVEVTEALSHIPGRRRSGILNLRHELPVRRRSWSPSGCGREVRPRAATPPALRTAGLLPCPGWFTRRAVARLTETTSRGPERLRNTDGVTSRASQVLHAPMNPEVAEP